MDTSASLTHSTTVVRCRCTAWVSTPTTFARVFSATYRMLLSLHQHTARCDCRQIATNNRHVHEEGLFYSRGETDKCALQLSPSLQACGHRQHASSTHAAYAHDASSPLSCVQSVMQSVHGQQAFAGIKQIHRHIDRCMVSWKDNTAASKLRSLVTSKLPVCQEAPQDVDS